MNRAVVTGAATLLSAILLHGCAMPASVLDEDDHVERARRDVRLDPLLSTSRVTITERDGVVVFGGSVDSLQDLNAVRDVVLELEQENLTVENAVVYLSDESDDLVPETLPGS